MASDSKKFTDWLQAQGAEVKAPTSSYEFARFRARGGVHVIYQKNNGSLTASGFGAECLAAWKKNGNLAMGYTGQRKSIGQDKRAALLARDGDACFFCAKPMQQEEISVEHLVALGKGGPNHLDNLVLAHKACNLGVGNLPLIQKIQLYHRSRIPSAVPSSERNPLPARTAKCRVCGDEITPGENRDNRCFYCFMNHRGEDNAKTEIHNLHGAGREDGHATGSGAVGELPAGVGDPLLQA